MKTNNSVLLLILFIFLHLPLAAQENSTLDQDFRSEPDTSNVEVNKALSRKTYKKLNVTDYAGVLSSADFSKYSVVQKKLLQKSDRLLIKTGLSAIMNDPFYSSYGLNLAFNYYLNDNWGIGLAGQVLNASQNVQVQNINDIQGVAPAQIATLKSHYNLSLYRDLINGKWAFANRKTVEFNVYLSAGIAQVADQYNVTAQATSLSLGQLYTLSETSAVDINLQGLFYTAKNINNQDQSTQSILLGVNYSFFWPQTRR